VMQNRLRSKRGDDMRRDCNTRYYEAGNRKENSRVLEFPAKLLA
jgi:hypothetical protein